MKYFSLKCLKISSIKKKIFQYPFSNISLNISDKSFVKFYNTDYKFTGGPLTCKGGEMASLLHSLL